MTVVARGADALRALGPEVATLQGDATNPDVAARVMREVKPELLVLSAGVTPTMGPSTRSTGPRPLHRPRGELHEHAMTAPSFTTRFTVTQSPDVVFKAIQNVRGWWSETVEGNTAELGDEFTLRGVRAASP